MTNTIQDILQKYSNDRGRLMDILLDIQDEIGFINDDAVKLLAEALKISKVDVEQTLTFYHFFTQEPRGEYTVYLNNSVVANMMGRAEVAAAFEREAECRFGSVGLNGKIGLFETACIGMSDQEPAAIINGKIFTSLTPYGVKELVEDMKNGKKVEEMIHVFGDSKNASIPIRAMVSNNIRKTGKVIFPEYINGSGLKKALLFYLHMIRSVLIPHHKYKILHQIEF